MSTFTENPLFLFVDDLVNSNSTSFANDGKIVELFDTGCDARTPGGTLKKAMEPDTANDMPDVRKPFKLSETRDRNPVKKNLSPATGSREDQGQNIGAVRKSLKQWNPPKDKFPLTKSNGFAVRHQVTGKRNVARGSDYSGRGNPAEKESRANGNLTESKMRFSAFGSRAKMSPTKTSKVTSEAALNRGLRKYVNRAVDKDSLSNCSRQLDAKTSGQASRLPRSSVVSKIQPKVTSLMETGRDTRIRSAGKTALTKVTGNTDLELLKRTTKPPIKISEAETIPGSKASKLSMKQPNIGKTDGPIASKMAASRVPLSRFSSRNLSTTKSTVKPVVGETSDELAKALKSTAKLSSSAPDNKSSMIRRAPRYQEKVLVHPSAKSHNLNPREAEARNSTLSFQTKLPRPMTPLIGPNLKPRIASGTLSRFPDRVDVTSKIPRSVSLSGVQGVDERDQEVELKTIFEDTSVGKSSATVPATDKTCNEFKDREAPAESKVPRPVISRRFPLREMGRISSSGTPIRKQDAQTPRGAPKNMGKKGAKKESAKPLTPPTMKSAGDSPESEKVPESFEIVEKEDEDEVVIPIMNPTLCNAGSFATQYRKKTIPEKTVPQETVRGGRIEPWIDGHEQAYLKGRAIGLRVASLARAAKEEMKGELIKTSPKNTTPVPIPRLDKSQEIVDIGISVIEKVLAEKNSRIHSPPTRRDRVSEYLNFDKSTKWNSRQWF